MTRFFLLAFFGMLTSWTPVSAQEVMLRADIPLWTGAEGEELYPMHFYDQDSFGCSSNVQFGDYREVHADSPERETWWRIGNYGVFHCGLLFSQASERTDLHFGFRDHAWTIVLDKVRTPNGEAELLAIQIGARGGSTYILLSRSTADGLNATMNVLDPVCPRGSVRQKAGFDSWRTDYCAVASQSALRRIAREAVRRPPVSVLEYVGPPLESDSTQE